MKNGIESAFENHCNKSIRNWPHNNLSRAHAKWYCGPRKWSRARCWASENGQHKQSEVKRREREKEAKGLSVRSPKLLLDKTIRSRNVTEVELLFGFLNWMNSEIFAEFFVERKFRIVSLSGRSNFPICLHSRTRVQRLDQSLIGALSKLTAWLWAHNSSHRISINKT